MNTLPDFHRFWMANSVYNKSSQHQPGIDRSSWCTDSGQQLCPCWRKQPLWQTQPAAWPASPSSPSPPASATHWSWGVLWWTLVSCSEPLHPHGRRFPAPQCCPRWAGCWKHQQTSFWSASAVWPHSCCCRWFPTGPHLPQSRTCKQKECDGSIKDSKWVMVWLEEFCVLYAHWQQCPIPSSRIIFYLGNEDLSLSRYSPRAFWIFPRRSASRSSDLCTPCMFSTSITKGDFDTFFISAKNSVLILWKKHRE